MSSFKCSGCEYKSDRKSNVKTHIDKMCKNSEILIVISKIKCEYCEKTFTLKSNHNRHLKICKVKKVSLEEEVKILKEKLAIAEALAKKPNTTIYGQNNNINNNINIQLAPWNNPSLPEDIEKYYREALKKLFLSVPTLIKQIHFNKDLPRKS
jgi:hypothetical protein